MIDIYNIGTTPEELRSALVQLRGDFDAHNHDGISSLAFQTLSAETVSARAMLIKKTSFADTASGIWMGLVGSVMKLKLGTASSYLEWTGTALNIVGSISGSTITGGTFQTATSGQRIVIAAGDNTLRFYDAVGQVIGIGSTGGVAVSLDLNATTVNGIQVSSSVAGIGFQYTNNGAVNHVGIDLVNTSNGGTFPSIRISKNGSGEVLYANITGASIGVYMYRSAGGGGGPLMKLHNVTTGGGSMLYILNNGISTGQAIEIDNTISASVVNIGILMAIAGGSSSLCYAFKFNGSEAVAAAVGATQNKKIRVLVGSTDYYIPLYTS